MFVKAAEGQPGSGQDGQGEGWGAQHGDVLRKWWWRNGGIKGPGGGSLWGEHPETTRRSLLNGIPTSDLTVPFLSFMDAEMARLYLSREEESLEGAVHRELRVTGSDLIM